MRKRSSKLVYGALTTVMTLIVVAAVAMLLGILPRTTAFDIIRLYNYEPSKKITQLAENTTMNDDMRRLFYVYHPDIADKKKFNERCRNNEQTIVLGCFVNYQGIYLLKITDERLKGVEEVTAAHEVLHAAYTRLSTRERTKVDGMTSAAFKTLDDTRVRDTIELYRKQDATIVPNELHSILGTEVRKLPSDLEAYYKQYFTDRSKIVSYSEQYEQVFTSQRNQIAAYDAELERLRIEIDSLQAALKVTETELTADRNNLNTMKNSGRINEYNEAVPAYNAKVNSFNAQIDRLTSIIAQYNDIVPKRNAVASEESELVKAIDSREVPEQQ